MFAPRGNNVKFIALCAALACLSNFQDSYPSSYPNTAFATFREFINDSYIDRGDAGGLSEFQYTWIWSAILNIWAIGYLIGTFIAPLFTERFGRRATLLGANAGSLIGTALSVIAVSCATPELLFVARFISSILSGCSCCALLLFLQETTPTEIRGITSFLSETVYLAIMVFGMGMGMDSVLGKRLPFLIGLHEVAGVLAVGLLWCMQETPKYLLITKKDHKAALRSLQFYRGTETGNEDVIKSIEKEAKGGYEAPFLASIPIVLKTSHLRQAFLVGFCSCQITLSIIPINYMSTIILEAHFSSRTAQIITFVYSAVNFAASLLGAVAVERCGRRKLLLSSALLNILSLCTYCVFDRLAYNLHEHFKYGCIVALMVYGISFGGGLGPIAFFITTELVPQQFRSAVQAMVFTLNTACNFVLSFVTLPLYNAIAIWGFIPLFIAPSLVSFTYLFFKLPETKGREIHEIVSLLAGDKIPDTTSTQHLGDHSSTTTDTGASQDNSHPVESPS